MFAEIENKIGHRLSPKTSRGISVRHKLATTLKFLAQGSYQLGVGNDFTIPIAQPTFSKIFECTLEVLEDVLKQFVTMEMSEEDKTAARRHFYDATDIPGVVMCVNGTHVRIIPPQENKEQYYNRKGNYSLNVVLIIILIILDWYMI
uniref:Putative nuclease harbi1 n=1 Tax=Anopheles darlingi TaxID=43151 RepID=A0A2M4CWW6_ANODA